jgi:hypothetical protein
MTLVAVNGRKFAPDVLDAAIYEAQQSHRPIELLVSNDEFYRTLTVPYYEGPRYPHLERVGGATDTLSEAIASRR